MNKSSAPALVVAVFLLGQFNTPSVEEYVEAMRSVDRKADDGSALVSFSECPALVVAVLPDQNTADNFTCSQSVQRVDIADALPLTARAFMYYTGAGGRLLLAGLCKSNIPLKLRL
jgi:hypothetical protein